MSKNSDRRLADDMRDLTADALYKSNPSGFDNLFSSLASQAAQGCRESVVYLNNYSLNRDAALFVLAHEGFSTRAYDSGNGYASWDMIIVNWGWRQQENI